MELSIRAVILGIGLALVLGAANAYLGLKVGMTVSASIPAAVISFAITQNTTYFYLFEDRAALWVSLLGVFLIGYVCYMLYRSAK
jgi:uncharacterized oligopeptide transporter (OPT) family protein